MPITQIIIIVLLVIVIGQNARSSRSTKKFFRREQMNLADLKTKVDAQTTVIQSAETLISTLSDEIRAAANDPAAIQAIADELDANTTGLAAAVSANTPAAPSA